MAPGAREPLVVLEPLAAFLDAHGLGAGEPELAPLGDGHSCVTYALARGDAEVVLRRPPRGPLPPSTHDVLREARVLRALSGRAPVPRVLAVCEDPAVIGAPFYVMERIEGDVVTDSLPPRFDAAGARRAIGEALIDALVEIHAVDWRAAGLDGFGRPDGYLARQLKRFGGLWETNRTRDVPAVDAVARWLGERMPESPAATVVHGDYRLGNVVWARRAGAAPRGRPGLGDVDAGRSARRPRLPVPVLGRGRRPERRDDAVLRARRARRASRRATSSSPATRSARAARWATCAGIGCWRCGS